MKGWERRGRGRPRLGAVRLWVCICGWFLWRGGLLLGKRLREGILVDWRLCGQGRFVHHEGLRRRRSGLGGEGARRGRAVEWGRRVDGRLESWWCTSGFDL